MPLLKFKIFCQKNKVISNIIKTITLTNCLKCKRNTENKDAKMVKTKNGIIALSSKCPACGGKK